MDSDTENHKRSRLQYPENNLLRWRWGREDKGRQTDRNTQCRNQIWTGQTVHRLGMERISCHRRIAFRWCHNLRIGKDPSDSTHRIRSPQRSRMAPGCKDYRMRSFPNCPPDRSAASHCPHIGSALPGTSLRGNRLGSPGRSLPLRIPHCHTRASRSHSPGCRLRSSRWVDRPHPDNGRRGNPLDSFLVSRPHHRHHRNCRRSPYRTRGHNQDSYLS